MGAVTPASDPPPNRSRAPLTMIAVAAVALVAGAGGAALATASAAPAATDSAARATPAPSSPAGGPSPGSRPSGHWPGFRGPMGGGFFAGPGGVVHGQVVVPAPGGKYRTEDIQTGKVTAVSGSSLTVRSADGYTKTYRVTSATQVAAGSAGIGSVKVGNEVAITATVSGPTATLTRVIDLSLVSHGSFAPGWPHQPPAAPATPPAG
jgi:hypothetical protein